MICMAAILADDSGQAKCLTYYKSIIHYVGQPFWLTIIFHSRRSNCFTPLTMTDKVCWMASRVSGRVRVA